MQQLLCEKRLGCLQDPLGELLQGFVLKVWDTHPELEGNAATHLHPLVSNQIWMPTIDKRQLPRAAGYNIALTAELFAIPGILSNDFLSQLSEDDIPDKVAVFSSDPIVAAIKHEWESWKYVFWMEFGVYLAFQVTYTWSTFLSLSIEENGEPEAFLLCMNVTGDAHTRCTMSVASKWWATCLAFLICSREVIELVAKFRYDHRRGVESKADPVEDTVPEGLPDDAMPEGLQSSLTGTLCPLLVPLEMWMSQWTMLKLQFSFLWQFSSWLVQHAITLFTKGSGYAT